MTLIAILLALLPAIDPEQGDADTVKVAPFQTRAANVLFDVQETTLLYDMVYGVPNSAHRQRLSILLSSHPQNVGDVGGAKVRTTEGEVHLKAGSVALCNTKLIPRIPPDPLQNGELQEYERSSTDQPENIGDSLRIIYPWWLIIFEDLEIGAEGTEMTVAVWESGANGGGRVTVSLHDGGPVMVRHHQLKGHLFLHDVDTMYEITWTVNPLQITVNGVVQDPDHPINAPPAPWPDQNDTDIQQVDTRLDQIRAQRSKVKEAPSMRLVPVD